VLGVARAQAPQRIGWLGPGSPERGKPEHDAFFDAMRRHGYEIGRNLIVDYRYAYGTADRLPALGRELTALAPALVVVGSHLSLVALKNATSTIPAVCPWRELVEAGGLVSYASDFAASYAQLAGYASKILKGVKPADLPVEQPNKYELLVNMKTARALGIAIPQTVLLRADRVIE
jgi:putative tryptophan/tyrosine transport system substrate-binding protein